MNTLVEASTFRRMIEPSILQVPFEMAILAFRIYDRLDEICDCLKTK